MSVVLFLFYFLSIRTGARMLAYPLERYYHQPTQGEINGDVIILLGSGATEGVPDFDGEGQPSAVLSSGLLFAARLQRFTNLPVIVSGGTVYRDTGSEADISIRNLRALGIHSDKLWAENRSRNTAENAKFCQDICRQKGWQRPILLAAALHSPRANLLFEKYGLKCQPYPTHYRCSKTWHFNPVLDLIPGASYLTVSADAIKEYLGIAAIKLGII